MRLTDLVHRLDDIDVVHDLIDGLSSGPGLRVLSGASGMARSLLIAGSALRNPGPILVATHHQEQAERLCADLRALVPEAIPVLNLPAIQRDIILRSAVDHTALSERIQALAALTEAARSVVVATAEAILQRTGPPDEMLEARIELQRGDSIALDMLYHRIARIGYERVLTVTRPGQFAGRGGIVDVFAAGADTPIRMELYGDEVETLRTFDPGTQRSIAPIERAVLLPARSIVLSADRARKAVPKIRERLEARTAVLRDAGRHADAEALEERVEGDLGALRDASYFDALEDYLPYIVQEEYCALDYLEASRQSTRPDGSIPVPVVILDDPYQITRQWRRALGERAEARERRLERGDLLEGAEWSGFADRDITEAHRSFASIALHTIERDAASTTTDDAAGLAGVEPVASVELRSAPMETFRNRTEFLAAEVERWIEIGGCAAAVTDQPQRTREVLTQLGVPLATDDAGSGMHVIEGRLRQGFKLDDAMLYVLTDAELYGRTGQLAPTTRARGGVPVSSLLELREGDYVVHVVHGIGQYRGLVRRSADGAEKDYLAIQYAGTDRLFVPADQIDRVQRYIGGEGVHPSLSRFGGADWQRTTRRVREQTREMARELLALYAARESAERPPLGEDSPWQAEMEDAFPHELTPGQAQAIADIKGDLASQKPADRLICGDVGYGKTEVAVRAAFKVIEAGKQVAVLCPTTILAAQHHLTFSERFAAYPVSVELLSRFRTRQEQQQTIANLKAGAADIVVGTHRLLSADVEFARLGLLIIDEEQRFGVAQKERLKQLRKTVDVLTLTATPIPRTLSMAMSGLRDMSVIEDPPEGRLPIATYVMESDAELIRDVILRELERDGQVYFVHNRVETIDSVAMKVQRLVPEARIRVGHGQMSEDELERVMHGFYHREYDILVSTTIIENGLDIPNVNTIIVNNADHFGLAQLYQLRGRVGRSRRQAHAYLLVRKGRALTEEAERRLLAVREFTALGSGYQIALRDLEIRGAGNLLGAQQSGAMSAVGFDMYCRLLAQEVASARGEETVDDTLPAIDMPVTANIPPAYIPNEAERMYFYKRLSGLRSQSALQALQEELTDRYGAPPQAVWNALEVVELRLKARDLGVAGVTYGNKTLVLQFGANMRLTPRGIKLLTQSLPQARFTADAMTVPLRTPRMLEELHGMLKVIAAAVERPSERTAATRRGGSPR